MYVVSQNKLTIISLELNVVLRERKESKKEHMNRKKEREREREKER
jgi:hypothetical protein